MNAFLTTILSIAISGSLLVGTALTSKTKIASKIQTRNASSRKIDRDPKQPDADTDTLTMPKDSDNLNLPKRDNSTSLTADENLLKAQAVSQTTVPEVTKNSTSADIDVETEIQHLTQKAPQINPTALKFALKAYSNAEKKGDVKRPVLTVIDFSAASNQKRMWIFDMQNDNLLYNTFVAHGKHSGQTFARHFSNTDSSKESSLGTYITRDTYYGHKGLSLNLMGMDKGFNSNALNRRVVVHGAWYVEPSFIKKEGRAGNSWGCPAVAQSMAVPIINTIKGGSVIFSYYPDNYFLSHAEFLES